MSSKVAHIQPQL